jgi:UDPglucose 6-dehydrogenase
MRIAIIGCGYVGLVSGACFADFGHHVTCIDSDTNKIEALNGGKTPFFEPGLDNLVAANTNAQRLTFASDLKESVAAADVVFIAVGTPAQRQGGHADLSYVYQAAREIAGCVDGFTVVSTKSTVPVGTGDEIERIIRGMAPAAEVAVVSNPEFLREGAAVYDFKHPDRIVIGSADERGRALMAELYRPLYLNTAPILHTDRRTAELIKYAANAFLATKISFINEVADLCERVGADVQLVARGIGLDNRIGSKFLHAGPGYGGSCLPKDTRALVETAREHSAPMRVLEAVVTVNDTRKHLVTQKIVRTIGGSVSGKTVAILGLTFKPNTDDMREAPSINIITKLREEGAKIRAYDPIGMEQARKLLPDIDYCEGPYDCATNADALIIITEWEQFRALDFTRLKGVMKQHTVVDLRNIYKPAEIVRHGFRYEGVGVPGRVPTTGACTERVTG